MKQHIDVAVLMRDGVRLSADVRMPDGDGPFPAVVCRTPYSNADVTQMLRYVDVGYALVTQDCRGRYDSDGQFNPFHEADDGFDTLAWVRRQPWCDGRIGMVGGSYCGTTQLTAAWLKPAGLRAITPRVMGRDVFVETLYSNGVFNLPIAAGWGLAMAGRAGQNLGTLDWTALMRHLPLGTMDEASGCTPPWFRQWLSHPTHDAFWKGISVESHWGDFDLPVLHMGGWYDVYSDGTLRNFAGIRSAGGAAARAHQRVVIGPWGHGLNSRTLGVYDFGPQAVTELDALEMRWLNRWVRGEMNGVESEPPVRIFVMGANVWRDEWEWPLARAKERVMYLSSGGRANSLHGDGVLVDDASQIGDAPSDGYTYNPDNPVPVMGGCVFSPVAGPQDHVPIERRDDVLVYTGPVLREPLEVTGHVRAQVFVTSDAIDTDFVARLCDVLPDGRSIGICDGLVRTRFRDGLEREVMMQPGRVYELTIEMGATSNVFLPAHRLRLEITSSCFPRFARNLNTGEPAMTGTRMVVAQQRVLHTQAQPSRLILPVVAAR